MRGRAAARCLAAGFFLLGGVRPAVGATLHAWKESPAPAKPYASKLTGAHRVQEALEVAVAGDTVLVHGDCTNAAGRCTYQENLSVPCGVTLRGDGTPLATPILDGGGTGRVIVGRGFTCRRDQVTTVARFEIQNGKPERYGGGIFFLDRRASITGNCIHDNRAHVGGGIAIMLRDDSLPRPVVQIEGNLIERNLASERGGGVTVEGVYTNPGRISDWHATFDGNTVRQNSVEAESGVRWGGGLDVYHSRVRARRNLFEQNTIEGEDLESYGGHVGVLNHDENIPLNQASALTLKNASDLEPEQFFSEGNIYSAGGKRKKGNIRGGGAIAAIWNASVRVQRDWASDNYANTGGAVYVNVRSQLEIDASHLEKNVAMGDGGVAYVVCDSRLKLNGDSLLEGNKAHGRSEVGGERMKGDPTPYPRGGGGLYVRNSRAELRGKNVLRKNAASGVATDTAGLGGGLLLWQVNKALLFPDAGPLQELEALICNGLTQLSVQGDNLFEDNTAEDEGGGIAILLEADRPGAVQRAGGAALGIDRPFERSQLLARTQLRGNSVPAGTEGPQRAGGLYYHESLLPGARQPAASKWAKGQTLVRGTLFEGNKGWGLKVVDTGLHLVSADGRHEWIHPTLEMVESTVQANSAGGVTLWHSWPRLVGNHFLGNREEQLYALGATHLPVLAENYFDGLGLSRAGVSVIRAPLAGASPGWANRFENNNLIGHLEHAAELELDTGGELHMERNYWGPNGPVVDDTDDPGPPNSIGGNVVTAPPLGAAVHVPVDRFARISVTPAHPSPPAIPECTGMQRDRPPGVPEEPPGRPPDTPSTPRQPDRSVPDRPGGESPPPPGQPAPVPDRPRSVPDQPRAPEPPPEPPTAVPPHAEEPPATTTPSQPAEPSRPSEPDSTASPVQPEWAFAVLADQVSPSTLGARNFCSRRHRFEITLETLPFLRVRGKPELEVASGEVEEVPVEIDSRGLAPGDYRGKVTIRCVTCGREPGCTQDRTVVPVRMTVLPPAHS